MVSPPLLPRRADQAALAACHARYESDAAVAQYCDAHYGPDKFGVPNFPAQLAQRCIAALAGGPRRRALDLGCAVGRASFELATRFDQVAGIDFSTRFIAIANRLKERGRFRYQLAEEGELISEQEVFLADLGLTTTAPRVAFYQGDVQQLWPEFTAGWSSAACWRSPLPTTGWKSTPPSRSGSAAASVPAPH